MCVCERGYTNNDCSARTCQFGYAHVDTPKGDLDSSSGKLAGPKELVVQNNDLYPHGTQEQFPNMVDSMGNILQNTAHNYMECSNKGICDRNTGTCGCFPGYEGSACQRASCPSTSKGVCDNHGTCETISNICALDDGNIYKLWDKDSTMGCVCDAGYTGADCSERLCKVGVDPLYNDDYSTVRYANFTIQFYTTGTSQANAKLEADTVQGNYSIVFTDSDGEEWYTEAIDIRANCDAITDLVEDIPNRVIPKGSVRCQQFDYTTEWTGGASAGNLDILIPNIAVVTKYILVFGGNPGSIPQIDVDWFLDGKRPTLFSTYATSTLGVHIYANGFTGEDEDLVPDWCEGLLVTIGKDTIAGYANTGYYIGGIGDGVSVGGTATDSKQKQSMKKLKMCLGDGDGDPGNNVDVYNWDHGDEGSRRNADKWSKQDTTNSYPNPHLIKLVEATQINLNTDTRTTTDDDSVTTHGVNDNGIHMSAFTTGTFRTGFAPYSQDPSLEQFPKTRLCTSMDSFINRIPFSTTAGSNGYPTGWCANMNPAGFYAVVFYDEASMRFTFLTNPGRDYATTTQFHVFTTQGFLRRVNSAVSVTNSWQEALLANRVPATDANLLLQAEASEFHSRVLYARPVENTVVSDGVAYPTGSPNLGQMDCETMVTPKGKLYGNAIDCLNKGDRVMVLTLPNSQAAPITPQAITAAEARALNNNPSYPNMYTVTKVGRFPQAVSLQRYSTKGLGYSNYDSENDDITGKGGKVELTRHQVWLDYGLNMNTVNIGVSQVDQFTPTIFKFHPAKTYKYVGQCANRGICDSASGLCKCFPGYTGDDCSKQNALAV